MQVVCDEQSHGLHVLTLLPTAGKHVPVGGRGDHNATTLKKFEINRRVASKNDDADAEAFTELLNPVLVADLCKALLWSNVHTAASVVIMGEHAEDGELGADGLATAVGCAHESLLVSVVQSAERLGLDRVEELEGLVVEGLEVRVTQRVHGEGLEIDQLSVRGVLLGEDQVAEGHDQLSLRVEPLITDDADKVLGGQGLEQWHVEAQNMVLLCVALLEQEVLLVENRLAINIFHEDPEGLSGAVHFSVPLKVRRDCQLNLQRRPRDRLQVGGELKLRELVQALVHHLAQLGVADPCTLR
eukprot:Colp12_sorted_trinity150504_noHs@11442